MIQSPDYVRPWRNFAPCTPEWTPQKNACTRRSSLSALLAELWVALASRLHAVAALTACCASTIIADVLKVASSLRFACSTESGRLRAVHPMPWLLLVAGQSRSRLGSLRRSPRRCESRRESEGQRAKPALLGSCRCSRQLETASSPARRLSDRRSYWLGRPLPGTSRAAG